MPLDTGTHVGPYAIAGLLGAGGMGEVYRARDSKLGRDVAIKVLPSALAHDSHYIARFQREAQVLAALNHPNIAAIYGLEENAIVMELVEGETLRGPLPLTEALSIAKQIAEALEAAHERGIVHRDLKPGNVKITPEGVVKVLDFGLGKAVEAGSRAGVADSPTMTIHATQAGIILGTAGYMSPEQAAGKPVDKRADIWSFGVVLWEMLTGKPIFDGETVSHTLAHVLTGEINLADVPAAVRPLLGRCLDRNVKTRLRDIGEARIEIEKLLSGRVPAEPTASAPPRRLTWVPWAAGFAGAVLALSAVWFLSPAVEREVVEFQIAPPEAGRLINPLLSPDGRKIVVNGFLTSGRGLYLRTFESAALRAISGTDSSDGVSTFWSPDSRRVGFFTSDAKLKTVTLDSGDVQTLTDAPRISSGAWSPAGVILFHQQTGPLLKIAENGGTASPALLLDQGRGETGQRFPVFLPDGRRFLYESVADRKPGLYLTSLDGVKPILFDEGLKQVAYVPGLASKTGYLMYLRQGQVFARPLDPSTPKFTGTETLVQSNVEEGGLRGSWSASRGAFAYVIAARSSSLSWFSRKGQSLGTVGDLADYREVRLAPDSSRAAYSRFFSSATNIWVLDLARTSASRLSFGSGERAPVWSPDGAYIAYASIEPGANRICRRASNGVGKEEVLLESKDEVRPVSWSPDGKWLLYLSGVRGHWDQYLLPLSGGGKPVAFLIDPYDKYDARFSPDGRWIAYSSNETGRREVYVRPVPEAAGGTPGLQAKWQISTSGGGHARWRKDGKELFFIGSPTRIMAVAVQSSVRSFQSSNAEPLFPVQVVSGPGDPYDVTSDGTRFLVLNRSDEAARVTVVLNWESRLK
jgi:Tol biopolymer transport system component/predicted Ser/Thr protein kinase